jgi:predicted PhzF superfamily epimerase YddE/YHI9
MVAFKQVDVFTRRGFFGNPVAVVLDGAGLDGAELGANACIAAWLAAHERLPAPEYRASQGREMGRDGIVTLRVDGDGVWLGGHSRTLIDGRIRLRD